MVSDAGKNFSQGGNYLQYSNSTSKNIQTSFKTINGERSENYFLQTADKELLERFEQFERNPKVIQPESPSKFNMGNPNKDSDGATGPHQPPGCPPGSMQPQPEERSQGCHLSQASSRGCSKENGQGLHTLPGLTQ